MVEHEAVSGLADFLTLDESAVLFGYISGYEGQPRPDLERCRSFYHGWRNGMVDSGRAVADEAQLALADELRHTSMAGFQKTAA